MTAAGGASELCIISSCLAPRAQLAPLFLLLCMLVALAFLFLEHVKYAKLISTPGPLHLLAVPSI